MSTTPEMPSYLEAVMSAALEIPSNSGSCHIGDSKRIVKYRSCYVGNSSNSTKFGKCSVNDYRNTAEVRAEGCQIAKKVYIEFLRKNK